MELAHAKLRSLALRKVYRSRGIVICTPDFEPFWRKLGSHK